MLLFQIFCLRNARSAVAPCHAITHQNKRARHHCAARNAQPCRAITHQNKRAQIVHTSGNCLGRLAGWAIRIRGGQFEALGKSTFPHGNLHETVSRHSDYHIIQIISVVRRGGLDGVQKVCFFRWILTKISEGLCLGFYGTTLGQNQTFYPKIPWNLMFLKK